MDLIDEKIKTSRLGGAGRGEGTSGLSINGAHSPGGPTHGDKREKGEAGKRIKPRKGECRGII